MAEKGLFIVIDGVDGAGKSTQIDLLVEAFRESGRDVVQTLEPGGTETGKRLRHEILHGGHDLTSSQEILLFSADRALHFAQVVIPCLNFGKDVICDRFASSTFAYQGFAGGGDISLIGSLTLLATADQMPDLIIIMSLDPEVGFKRKTGAGLDRIESKSLEYHRAVQNGYLRYARLHREICEVIDASKSIETVHQEIVRIISDRLGINIRALKF